MIVGIIFFFNGHVVSPVILFHVCVCVVPLISEEHNIKWYSDYDLGTGRAAVYKGSDTHTPI